MKPKHESMTDGRKIYRMTVKFSIDSDLLETFVLSRYEIDEEVTAKDVEKYLRVGLWDRGLSYYDVILWGENSETFSYSKKVWAKEICRKLFPLFYTN